MNVADLLDGATLTWDFISGRSEFPTIKATTTTQLPPPVRRDPMPVVEPVPTRRLVAGGLFVAGALAAHWRRGRS